MGKQKRATIAQPDPNSKRSKRRAKRGWKSLEQSSRKHKRAQRRLLASCKVYGSMLKPGEKKDNGAGSFVHTAGGSLQYH